ncbi:predicted protein [Sclerotinia sclerotiorum 1980 UF-70]|uniref:Uncharacterized protein n=1 Tax=Sclerotinia sclerotiorum (strain ATCC 18683 / 1980 / Ss-1) TaxID=665079 RepID=A7EEC3_SCLS1|nr:predicted protein [Sclerotinia sclerotiorum 1980 UF-70]EDO01189.1 predicted protein [Sclerotinia sclerotiorum 1980 UF-70]
MTISSEKKFLLFSGRPNRFRRVRSRASKKCKGAAGKRSTLGCSGVSGHLHYEKSAMPR